MKLYTLFLCSLFFIFHDTQAMRLPTRPAIQRIANCTKFVAAVLPKPSLTVPNKPLDNATKTEKAAGLPQTFENGAKQLNKLCLNNFTGILPEITRYGDKEQNCTAAYALHEYVQAHANNPTATLITQHLIDLALIPLAKDLHRATEVMNSDNTQCIKRKFEYLITIPAYTDYLVAKIANSLAQHPPCVELSKFFHETATYFKQKSEPDKYWKIHPGEKAEVDEYWKIHPLK